MIRDFELFCNLNRIRTSDISIAEETIGSFSASRVTCPFCGATHCCSNHGSYQRDMITIKQGTPYVHVLTIPRIICSSCRHTHALLPANLIPYGSYSLFFILTVLQRYFLKTMTVEQLCDSYQISISTLYHWRMLFRLHKDLWLGVLKSAQTNSPLFLDGLWHSRRFLQRFFGLTNVSFLQPRKKTTRSNPP